MNSNLKSLVFIGLFSTSAVLAASAPAAIRQYSVFASRDIDLRSSRVDGRVAAVGNVSLNDYAVGAALYPSFSRCDLSVGGDLQFNRGSVSQGAICVSGRTSLSQVSRKQTGYLSSSQLWTEAQEARSYSTYLAKQWGQPVPYESGKPILMQGSHPIRNQFAIDANAIEATSEITIQAPSSSLVIVNVYGNRMNFHTGAVNLRGIAPERVLFNLPDAEHVSLSQVNWQGSLLAPQAELSFHDGRLDGSVAVMSVRGNGYFGNHPLNP